MTICTDIKTSGYWTYLSGNISQERQSQLTFVNHSDLPNFNFSISSYIEFVTLLQTKYRNVSTHNTAFLSPEMDSPTRFTDAMTRLLIMNYNNKLYQMTNHALEDVVISCTFNSEDCRFTNRFRPKHYNGNLNCFTFNFNANESVKSVLTGLDLTLFKNSSTVQGSRQGVDAFVAIIHDPKAEPFIERDGIYLERGRLTTVKIKRNKMERVNMTPNQCNETSSEPLEECMRRCIFYKCIVKWDPCYLFDPFATQNDSDWNKNFSGFEIQYCFFAAMYAAGIDPMTFKFFKVNVYLQITFDIYNSDELVETLPKISCVRLLVLFVYYGIHNSVT